MDMGAPAGGRAAVSPDADSGPGMPGRASVPPPAGAGDGLAPGRATAGVDDARSGAVGVPRSGDRESGLRGAGAELRQKMRSERQLRQVTLMSLAALVLLVLPAIFGIRALTSDPVFSSLDDLKVPAWAATKVEDQGSGSRWCFLDCRFRERIAESEKPFADTSKAYTTALAEAGWKQWKVAECPETPVNPDEGAYSCWQRDEFTLDLYVSLPGCAVEQALPEAGNPEAATAEQCVGSTVNIKVRNTITDERGKTDQAPGPVGVTPDPTLPPDSPLLEPTPEAS
ncbi:hypothetical protein AB0F81_34175 [Actinoplanes sp. NPDC024001]|uniref:hypothetical protein n=1 Tax=Actinoplanes sp. NPDC024001 TaxID=3154598 RepID=UPI0033D204E6